MPPPGLAIHPGYLSARVTLGRALIELGELDAARRELEIVLGAAQENLSAIRGLAEIHHRQGDVKAALTQYLRALSLAPNDPDLEETVADLTRQLEASARSELASPTLRTRNCPCRAHGGALEGFLAAIHGAGANRRLRPACSRSASA